MVVVMHSSFKLNAKEFIPGKARRQHHHSRKRYVGSLGSGEAGHRVGTHARQEGRECRRWLGRLHPVNGKQGAYRATKQREAFALEREKRTRRNQKEEGTNLASASEESSTRGP